MYTFLAFTILTAVVAVTAGPIKHYGPAPNTAENIALIASGVHRQKIEELSGQFEGDIILSDEQRAALDAQLNGARTGLTNLTSRWPGNVVPVEFTADLDDARRALVDEALRTIEAAAPCIKFVPRVDQADYVQVHGQPTGCWSMVGRYGGKQDLNLQLNGCMYQRTIVHEFLHALGFFHMQSSYRRDEFIRIGWEHIIEGMQHNFNKYSPDVITNFGFEYDIKSIMHYSAYSFTKNGFATMIPNDISEINRIGYYPTMSVLDIKRLNAMYCDGKN